MKPSVANRTFVPRPKPLTQKEEYLIRRYLVWCYKTTKEELDRIERYFTQAMVDDFLLKQLKDMPEYASGATCFGRAVDDFAHYACEKKARALEKKFLDPSLQTALRPEYVYLKARFEAIEEAIRRFLGRKELQKITLLYEGEITERILKAREHAS